MATRPQEPAPRQEITDDTPETAPGLSRESLRDRDAIYEFISMYDKFRADSLGLSQDDAVRLAGDAYDRVHEKDISYWDADPDLNPGDTQGDYQLQAPFSEVDPEAASGKAYWELAVKAGATEKEKKLAEAEEHYAHNGTPEGKAARLKQIEDAYTVPGYQEEHVFKDKEKQVGPDGKMHYFTVEKRARKAKELFDFVSDAVQASYEARKQALIDGKTLEEANELGVSEYNRVKGENINIDSPEERREFMAITAFNNERDMQKRKKLGKYEHGWALHRALGKFQEVMREPLEQHVSDDPDNDLAPTTSPASPNLGTGGVSPSGTGSPEPAPGSNANTDNPEQEKSKRNPMELIRKIADKVIFNARVLKEIKKSDDLGFKDVARSTKEKIINRIIRADMPAMEKKKIREKNIDWLVNDEIKGIEARKKAYYEKHKDRIDAKKQRENDDKEKQEKRNKDRKNTKELRHIINEEKRDNYQKQRDAKRQARVDNNRAGRRRKAEPVETPPRPDAS